MRKPKYTYFYNTLNVKACKKRQMTSTSYSTTPESEGHPLCDSACRRCKQGEAVSLHCYRKVFPSLPPKRVEIFCFNCHHFSVFSSKFSFQAEKLYKASMSYLLAGDTKEDDNAILEMSLKLASIYAAQKQHKLALAGFEFCILTLEEKIAKQKDLPEDVLSAEEKANTRLLLGMSLDSYARYLLDINQLPVAQKMYEKALQISNDVQGETHPQTVVLMNDLATMRQKKVFRFPNIPVQELET
ncbi:tetratricopeptide repeat protein hypothetical protein [Limosa lapponica baueri]|uniref:Uncharacterized protein n=1 Tax=Limosa lapponica baueri TaxID=1758121 RepID=A0A2I0TGZ2_LIMLA|nr:tetratricopeptide repeat protein hypothetical protein [Limosa lapponica baueri]